MGVVVIGLGAWEDGVSIGGGAVELQSPQILSMNWFMVLQHFDRLVNSEPLPLTACRGRQRIMDEPMKC